MAYRLLTRSERRSIGRFDTPRPLAQAVTNWAVRTPADTVLEPSAGGGVIVQSIVSRLNELGATHAARQVAACDVDRQALAETADSLARCPRTLVLGNFLEMDLNRLGGKPFDVVVGNPPYVRLHMMNIAAREAARGSLPEDGLLDAKASLWAYFPIHAFKFLKPGGRMAWILPETLIHSEYGKQLLHWAGKSFSRCIAVSLREQCFKLHGAKERVVILLLEGAAQLAAREIEMVEYHTAFEGIAAMSWLATQVHDALPKLNGHAVPHLVSSDAAHAATILETSRDLIRLGDMADIRIGVVTGDNSYFVMSEGQRRTEKLRRRHFQPIVSKFSDLGGAFVFDGVEQQYHHIKTLLLCPNPRSNDRSLIAYLAKYPAEKIKTNRTMQKRAYWQCPLLGQKPDAFLRYMGTSGPRMILNNCGSYSTNTIHGVFFKKGVDKWLQRAICLALHSTYTQLSAEFEGRQYGSGVLKLEPSEAKRLSLPGGQSTLEALAQDWRKLARKAKSDGWEQVVCEIDSIVLSQAPHLSRMLPIEGARSLLQRVRQRRTGTLTAVAGKESLLCRKSC